MPFALRLEHRSAAALMASALACLLTAGCSGDSIQGIGDAGLGGRQQDVSHKNKKKGDSSDDEGTSAVSGSNNRISEANSESAIAYPKLTFQSIQGNSHCGDHDLPTTAKIAIDTAASTTTMGLNTLAMDCSDISTAFGGRDECIDKTTSGAQRAMGTSIYEKASDDELAAAKAASGLKIVPYANYAKAIQSAQKGRATVNPPIPTTILPGPRDRYEELAKQPQTWNTIMTPGDGGGPFPVELTLRYAGDQGDITLIEMTARIPTDSEGELYGRSPIPYQTTMYIDTKSRDVVQIQVKSYFPGDCHGRGQVDLRFQLCSKITGDKVEGTPCP